MNDKYFSYKKTGLISDTIAQLYKLLSQANSVVSTKNFDSFNLWFYDIERLLSDTRNKIDELNKNEYVELEYEGYLEWLGNHSASVNLAEILTLKNLHFIMESNINKYKRERL
ncbi:MAG: hypothetical protein IJP96_10800 [Synergistaceae bacterium]|nr:hypothetical protein [Synergistaceae bacterium]MBR0076228.1 hypothetical protein [Synergistaceae bacterium]MBR0079399.1 hypothetical protein [Synergistaceae bacterium]